MLSFSRALLDMLLGKLSLTESTMTRQVSQKGVRRPQKAQLLAQRERTKKKRRERSKEISEKQSEIESVMRNENVSCRDVALAQVSNVVFSKGHKHIATATNISFVPDGNPSTPLVAFGGRCQVGKTALLRALFRNAREVGKSNRLLRRDGMNFFNVGSVLNIVDLPGFGGTSISWSNVLQYANLLRNFSRFQPSLKMIYYCLDVNYKHGLYMQDVDILRFLSREVPNFTVVLTKADQLNDSDKASNLFRTRDIREELIINEVEHPVLVTSAFKMGGIDTLRFDIVSNCLHALPTERLTYTEAKRLSDRLLSQAELSAIRRVSPSRLSYSSLNDVRHADVGTELKAETEFSKASLSIDVNKAKVSFSSSRGSASKEIDETVSQVCESCSDQQETTTIEQEKQENLVSCLDSHTVVNPDASLEEAARKDKLKRVNDRLTNQALMAFVRQTSPWRNPLLWPSNVIPTKSLKSNIMRSPLDPDNPYLYQPHFVARRADMYFRKPNEGIRKSSRKGRLEVSNKKLNKTYTIPYFPEIVDINLHPSPWMFVGSKEAYYERSGGKELGIQLTRMVLEGIINPISAVPAPNNWELTKEVKLLEGKQSSTPIFMLEPPA